MTGLQHGASVLSAAPKPAEVEIVLSRIDALPTLPPVATRLIELTLDPGSSAREVIEVIGADQSLSARLLAVARRSDQGARINSIDRAVVLLGLNAVRNLVLSIQIFETFTERMDRAGTRFDRAGAWRHALAVACAARLLAGSESLQAVPPNGTPPGAEEAFLCGLTHDVGKIVLDVCFPKSYDRVVARVEQERANLADIEREVFGLDHMVAGRRLVAHWKLPEMISECIWLHHHTPASTPASLAHPTHVRIVQVADRLVREMRIGYSGHHGFDDAAQTVAEALSLTPDDLKAVRSALPEWIEARAELIGLNRLTSEEVYQEALGRANAELGRSNASLLEANRRLATRSACFEALRVLHEGLSPEATHEDVCRASLEALKRLDAGSRWAVVGVSTARGLMVFSAGADNGAEPLTGVQPLPEVGGAGRPRTVRRLARCDVPASTHAGRPDCRAGAHRPMVLADLPPGAGARRAGAE